MSTIAWIIIGMVAIPFIWWDTKVMTSFLVPVSAFGREYLKQCLSQRGIDPRYVPDACIDEFVAIAQKSSSFPVRSDDVKFRADVVLRLGMFANLFVLWRKNPKDSMFQNHGTDKNWYREIFERFNVK